jgi:hypothetical protein
VNVTGAVSLSDTILSINLGFNPTDFTDRFYLLRNDGTDPISGTFRNLPEGREFTVSGQLFRITYLANAPTAVTGGNDVALLAIPEPGVSGLWVAGLAAFCGWHRRRGGVAGL